MASESLIKISALGPLIATDSAGEPLEIRSKKARGLLVYLACAPGVRRTRDHLAALLWTEMSRERARQSLRQCLSTLRKTFAGCLEIDKASVTWLARGAAVDVAEFRAAADADDPEAWQAAIDRYRGELAEGLAIDEPGFEEWLLGERRELARVAGRLCLRLADARAAAGDDERAEEALHRRLALDPCSEDAHRQLMQLYARTGRRSEALRQYEQCRDLLRREFDVAPSPHTERAHQQLIAAGDAPAAADAPLPLPARPSIAVLPFDNASGDRDKLYFSDGIAEDIIVGLSRFDTIVVIARSSTFSFRDRAVDATKIGRTLGVHYVLQGSVRRARGVLRVSAQLIDAGTGRAVWANTYDRPADRLFELQDELVETIVATLASRVESHSAAQLRRRPTESLEAYECLLMGKYHHHRYSPRDNQQAQVCLRRAIELDPDFAVAHAWLACVVAQSHSFGAAPSVFHAAYRSALTARRLNDSDSECHRILAAYYLMQRRFDECQLHQRRALELNPNDDRIVAQMGEILGYLGEPAEAVTWLERAMRLNPYHPDGYFYDYGRVLYDAGRITEAVEALRRIAAPRPGHLLLTAAACAAAGDPGRAADHVAAARELQPDLDPATWAHRLPYRDDATGERLASALTALRESAGPGRSPP